MVELEEMKEVLQEWMAQPTSQAELARLYGELRMELEKQLDYCMEAKAE
ncbi:MAG: hypothetical protein ACK5L3_08630 [Oscillospiraceae bacterium]